MPESTPQAKKLYKALQERRIKCYLEEHDGHKHIDISIPWAKLDIEVDGLQHYLNVDQVHSDLNRTYYSQENDEFDTFHIPNSVVERHLHRLADTIAQVSRDRYKAIQDGDL